MSKQNKLRDLTGPLSVITWCCSDVDKVISFLRGKGVVCTPVPSVANEELENIKLYWGIPGIRSIEIYEALLPNQEIKMRIVAHGEDVDLGSSLMGMKSLSSRGNEGDPISIQPNSADNGSSSSTSGSRIEGVEELITIASDQIDDEVEFYTKVLGKKAELIEENILFKSPSSRHSAIRLEGIEGEDNEQEIVARFPNIGWVMSSYETSDLGEVLARAHATENKVYRTPRKIIDPVLGNILCMSVLSPTGMVIEVYQKVKE